jgi:hypothetical protein
MWGRKSRMSVGLANGLGDFISRRRTSQNGGVDVLAIAQSTSFDRPDVDSTPGKPRGRARATPVSLHLLPTESDASAAQPG